MAAGGYKEFVAGETLDQDEINDFLMQGMLVFGGTAARGSAITSPVEGQFAFLTDSDTVTYHDGSDWVELAGGLPEFNYLVIGGGGGGGTGSNITNRRAGGGAGAGGYRCSVTGENTGGGLSAEPSLFLDSGSFTVTVGAGGPGGALGVNGTRGSDSLFGVVRAPGGGEGSKDVNRGFIGGSGGGAGSNENGARGLEGLGFAGGNGAPDGSGGGGGASAAGTNGATNAGGNGGNGVASSITGSSFTRGGGGAGVGALTSGTAGTGGGGTAGGGTGTANTGGGGGGGFATVNTGGNGGSGIVILKYPSNITLTIGAGLTSSTTTSGDFKITSFTAGTDTVSF